ncbi:MAG: heme utilization protein [Magnetospirillum sp.]|nr:heme utilization protein [Magnetospirillum sp.]
MNIARITALTVLISALAGTAAAAPPCFNAPEMRAAQMRQLHVQLQVASLNCRAGFPELPGQYASYVQRFAQTLALNAKVLEGHFSQHFGKDHRRQFDRFVTSLANEESQRAHQVANYCEDHAPLFDKIMALKHQELEGFATRAVAHPVAAACAAETRPVKTEKPAARKERAKGAEG